MLGSFSFYCVVCFTAHGRNARVNGVQPLANVLLKIADVLDTSVDFLISGDKNQRIKQALKDAELINQFKAVEQMNDKDKNIIKALIDAFITKKQLQKLL